LRRSGKKKKYQQTGKMHTSSSCIRRETSAAVITRDITLLLVPGKVFNRTLLERMRNVVDVRLRDPKADFRQDRSCAIVEQSLEWNSLLCVNFVNFGKAFNSLHHGTM
jgi:hypothetical protein